MNLKSIIVDDEYLAIKVLEEYASKMDDLQIEKTFTDSREALQFIRSTPVDLLLLDIQMPYLTGFELIRKIEPAPLIIFTTARHDFAVQAYELDVLDYLVKPIAFDRFKKAIEKAKEYIHYKKNRQATGKDKRNFIMIKADYRVIKLMHDSIEYIEGLGEYVKIHTNEKTFTTLMALKDLEDELPASDFIRIHKSYIVPVNRVSDFNSQFVRLVKGNELPIGRAYKNAFMEKMGK